VAAVTLPPGSAILARPVQSSAAAGEAHPTSAAAVAPLSQVFVQTFVGIATFSPLLARHVS
jgi:hypothetical protein